MVEIRTKKELHRTSFVYGLVTIFKQSPRVLEGRIWNASVVPIGKSPWMYL
jgi:hypothetical protein